jgi:hypothetical protein
LVLRRTRDLFCSGSDRAFFHFYLFRDPNRDIPLNWMLSAPAVTAIKEQMDSPGNDAELECLRKVLGRLGSCAESTATALTDRNADPQK